MCSEDQLNAIKWANQYALQIRVKSYFFICSFQEHYILCIQVQTQFHTSLNLIQNTDYMPLLIMDLQ
jgi:hypothetical protein